jgi:outer membrane protein OmpA-like peptidoglycan-associated protein
MTKIYLRSFASPVRLGLPICAALLVSSCGLLRHSQGEAPSLPKVAQSAPHLAQMNFGRRAEFRLCTSPVCPTVTLKTLAPPPPKKASPEPRPSAAASTLDAGEEIIAASPDTTTGSPSPFRRATKFLSKTVTVHFRFGDASLSAADKVVLDHAVASALDAKHIVISGRTDSIGPASANEWLATARARTVTDYLRTQHPDLASVLKLDAQGACCYVASNDTEQGRSLNRRVDVLFSGEGGQPP